MQAYVLILTNSNFSILYTTADYKLLYREAIDAKASILEEFPQVQNIRRFGQVVHGKTSTDLYCASIDTKELPANCSKLRLPLPGDMSNDSFIIYTLFELFISHSLRFINYALVDGKALKL